VVLCQVCIELESNKLEQLFSIQELITCLILVVSLDGLDLGIKKCFLPDKIDQEEIRKSFKKRPLTTGVYPEFIEGAL